MRDERGIQEKKKCAKCKIKTKPRLAAAASSGGDDHECCVPVVDSNTFIFTIGGAAVAVYFLRSIIINQVHFQHNHMFGSSTGRRSSRPWGEGRDRHLQVFSMKVGGRIFYSSDLLVFSMNVGCSFFSTY